MNTRIALIPAYEPDATLHDVVAAACRAGFAVIVVDDGSGRAYSDVFDAIRGDATVLTHLSNRGKGAALKTGLAYMMQRQTEPCTIVTLDADGQHGIGDALAVCREAESNPDKLVLGSRQLKRPDVKVPPRSAFGNAVTRIVFRLRAGVGVFDTQTGLRGFSWRLADELQLVEGERYEYEMNVLLHCADNDIGIVEVPIRTIYIDSNKSSHFDALRDSARIYRCIFRRSGHGLPQLARFALNSFSAFVTDYALYAAMIAITGVLGVGTSAAVTLSNITARVASASVNYTVNRRIVFRSDVGVARSGLQYLLLAVGILIGNTALLNVLVGSAGINIWVAKVLTELTFFVISWTVQRMVIFRRRPEGKPASFRIGKPGKPVTTISGRLSA